MGRILGICQDHPSHPFLPYIHLSRAVLRGVSITREHLKSHQDSCSFIQNRQRFTSAYICCSKNVQGKLKFQKGETNCFLPEERHARAGLHGAMDVHVCRHFSSFPFYVSHSSVFPVIISKMK